MKISVALFLILVSSAASADQPARQTFMEFAECTFLSTTVKATSDMPVFPSFQIALSQWGIPIFQEVKQDGMMLIPVAQRGFKYTYLQTVNLTFQGDGSRKVSVTVDHPKSYDEFNFVLPLGDPDAMKAVVVNRTSDGATLVYTCKQVIPLTD